MSLQRLWFASNVLQDGRLFVMGGEYSGPNSIQNNTKTGEIFNPLANNGAGQWTNITSFPYQANFGDDPTETLPNGQVLTGGGAYNNSNNGAAQTYFFNPSTNQWSVAASKVTRGTAASPVYDSSDEETWLKLRDGSILTYDVWSSINDGKFEAERYVPSLNQWVDASTPVAANPPSLLSGTNVAREMGPAFLLPDGDAFFVGGNGNTAYYQQATGKWIAGPTLPHDAFGQQLVAADAPGAMLPSGKILLAVSPLGTVNSQGNYSFPTPTYIYEFDPNATDAAQQYINVTPPSYDFNSKTGYSLQVPSYQTTMLVLPTGQVLLSNGSTQSASNVTFQATLEVYTPSDPPNNTWAPSPTGISGNSDGSATLTGFTLTGGSEGAAYGDDAEMASNYPLIQVTDGSNVSYARTSYWSHTDVQDDTNLQTVQFSMPFFASSVTELKVIASGLSSPYELYVRGTGGNDTITLDTITAFGLPFITVNVNGNTSSWYAGDLGGVFVNTGNGTDTVNIDSTWFGVSTYVSSGAASTTVNVGTGGSVQNVNGYVKIDNPLAFDTINIDDSADNASRLVTVSSYTPTGDSAFGSITGLAPAEIDYEYADTRDVNITTGSAADTVNAYATGGIGTTFLSSSGGRDIINVGLGNTQNITATLNIANPPSYSTINVDDTLDPSAHNITMGIFTPPNDTLWGFIRGLAPAEIHYKCADTSYLSVNTSAVDGNVVGVWQTGVPTYLVGDAETTVNVGNGADGVQSILGTLYVENTLPSSTVLTIGDTPDRSARTVSVATYSPFTNVQWGSIGGWSPASVNYEAMATASVTITGGPGGDTYNVQSTPFAAFVQSFGLAFTTTTINCGGNDIVNVGDGSGVQDIGGQLTVNGTLPDAVILNLNDQSDFTGRTVTVTSSSVFGLAPAEIDYGTNSLGNLNLNGDGGSNTWTVQSTPGPVFVPFVGLVFPWTTLNCAGTDTVNVGDSNGVQDIDSPMTINSALPDVVALNLNDQPDPTGQTVAVSSSSVFGLAPVEIDYGPLSLGNLNINGGTGANTFNVQSTAAPAFIQGVGIVFTITTITGGRAADTVNVGTTTTATSVLGGIAGSLTFDGGGGSNTLNVRDGGQPAGQTYSLSATDLMGSSFGGIISYASTKLLLTLGSGNDSLAVTDTIVPTGVTANGGPGINTLTGPNLTNTWTINGANAGYLSAATKLAFSNFQHLTGGSGNDTFKFTGLAAGLSGTLSGGAGTLNKLDYSGYHNEAALSVALSSPSSGSASLIGSGFSNIQSLVGSPNAGDTLTGTTAATTWTVTALNGGKAGTFAFTGIENLHSSSGADTFKISNGKGVGGSIIGSTISGGGEAAVLDYSLWTTPVAVNLQTGAATGVGGVATGFHILNGGKVNDTLIGSTGPDIIRGNAGDDVIDGNTGNDVLIGGAGNDTLSVPLSSGGSILIGSQGADHLTGGTLGCILIGGYTSYDPYSAANDKALTNILNEWASAADTYTTRIAKIRAGVGTGKFATTTVHDDAITDVLTGKVNFSAGNGEWFWAGLGTNPDSTNAESGEQIN